MPENHATAEEHRNEPTIEQLTERYLLELRQGQQPSISEYARRYPALDSRIREVFPALAMLERLRPASTDLSHPKSDAPALSQLGEYRILRELGRGGMGVVYEAVQETLGRLVALKVLPNHMMSDRTFLERFHREARVAARLHHSNIVPVFDVGEHNGVHYFAMQFIHGLGLDQVLVELKRLRTGDRGDAANRPHDKPSTAMSRQVLTQAIAHSLVSPPARSSPQNAPPIDGSASFVQSVDSPFVESIGNSHNSGNHSSASYSPIRLPGQSALSDSSGNGQPYYRSVARVGLQIADALGYMHAQNLLHRDIKPSNLLLDTQGTVWITDLGLARDDESDALTRSGDIVGTVRYMAPERFRGHVDACSDLYGLGLTLYELLALKPAFDQADRSQLILDITTTDPPRLQKHDARIPRDLETIVLKLIDREPQRRYQHAADVADDLRKFLDDRPIKARRIGSLERSWRWCRRNKAVAALLVSVAALLVTLAFGGSFAALVFRDQAAKLKVEQNQSTRLLYESLFAQAQSSRWSGRVGQRFESLRALEQAAELGPKLDWTVAQQLALRNEAIACVTLADVRLAQPVHRTPRNARVLAFDVDLARYAWSTEQGDLHLFNTNDHKECCVLPGPGVRAHVAEFSPDGRLLTAKYHAAGPPQLKVWDLAKQTTIWESAGDQFHFSPDGQHLAIGQLEPTVQIVDVRQKQINHSWAVHAQPGCIRFHPISPRLAVASLYSRDVQIQDSDNGEVLHTLVHPDAVHELNWNCDGTMLACACNDRRVYLWDMRSAEQKATLVGHRAEAVGVTFDHTRDLIASYSWDHTTRLWNSQSGRQLMGFNSRANRFSLDDKRLACSHTTFAAGDEVRIFEFAAGDERQQLVEPKTAKKGPYHLDVNGSGTMLVSSGPDGTTLWNLVTRQQLAFLPEQTENDGIHTSASLFATDGKSLFTTGADGLRRWPLQPRKDQGDAQVVVGPPQAVSPKMRIEMASIDRESKSVAFVHEHQGYVLHLNQPDRVLPLVGHDNVAHIVISPDGRSIVTGTWHGFGVVTWDARTGQKTGDLFPEADSATVVMSRDGRWLAAGANEVCRIWEVGSWKLRHEFPAASPFVAAFSPDGSTLALSQSPQAIRLWSLTTGDALAVLDVDDAELSRWACFTPDGSRLAVAHHNHVIHVWDLARIRQQLGKIGLDWPAPPCPSVRSAPNTPLTVEVDLGLHAAQ